MKNQLGDRMPIAMKALEKSTGKTAKELMKMMEQGQLTAEYIQPMIMAMGELAEANGAYEKALKKLGTVENRLRTTSQLASARIAEAGFTKGLINLYETLMKSMNENGATLNRIGKIYEKVFNAIAVVVEVASHWIEVFIRSIESVYLFAKNNPFTTMFIAATAFAGVLKNLPALLTNVGKILVAVFRKPLMVITMLMAAIDEIRAMFDANVIGLGENENASQEDRDLATAAFKMKMGVATAKDKALVGAANPERLAQAQANAGGIAGIFGAANPETMFSKTMQHSANSMGLGGVSTFVNTLGTNRQNMINGLQNMSGMRVGPLTSAVLTPFAYAKTGIDYAMGNEKPITVNQHITVQGNMSEDNVRQVKQAVESITSMQTVSSR